MDSSKEVNLMDYVFSTLMEESLERAIQFDFSYQENSLAIIGIAEVYQDFELNDVEKSVIDKYIELSNLGGALYGKCAYETGFRDCIKILKELDVIPSDILCD